MATAKDVKTILQQTTDGVENVKLVNVNVKAVDEMVKTMADGGQHLFSESYSRNVGMGAGSKFLPAQCYHMAF